VLTTRSPDEAARHFLASLSRPAHLLIAISGGSDSTGLLIALVKAIAAHDFPHRLSAVTIDHALRPASASEAEWVAALCARHAIPHQTRRWTGEKPRTGISAAARQARYRLLADTAHDLAATAIVTGHTLDDQIETVSMRASRGAEENLGLAGMAPATLFDRRVWLLRPFLDTGRKDIRDDLRRTGQSWIDDPSNDDRAYERVRIRQDLEASAYDAGAASRRLALSQATADWLATHAELIAGAVVRLPPQALAAPADILRHGLATLAAVLGGRPHRPSARAMDRLTVLTAAPGSGSQTLSGCLVVKRRDGLWMLRERRGVLPLPLPAQATVIWDGRFAISNRTDHPRRIEPSAVRPIPAELPGLARAAMAGIWPDIREESGVPASSDAGIAIVPHLPLFDAFLPGFDLALAAQVDAMLGRAPALSCPI
jgi:tRNA(Ile)-lysidine synthase